MARAILVLGGFLALAACAEQAVIPPTPAPLAAGTSAPHAEAPPDPSTSTGNTPPGANSLSVLGLDCTSITGRADAVALFEKGCANHDAEGCHEASFRYVCAAGVAYDPQKAATLAGQACELGAAGDCGNAGAMYVGSLTGLPLDGPKAVHFLTKGCDADDIPSCNNLALLYMLGKGVPPDPPRALELFEKLCTKDNLVSCANAAMVYVQGDPPVARDTLKARGLATKACDQTITSGCNILGMLYMNGEGGFPKDAAKGFELFRRACDGGDAGACSNVASAYVKGLGAPADVDRARATFRKACAMGNAFACTQAGHMLEQDPSQR